MLDLAEAFLSLPIGGRATIFTGVLFLLWCIFARPILKILSILLWLLKKFFFGLYMLLEIPMSILHSKFGSVFGQIDQGLTIGTEKVYNFMDKLSKKMIQPKDTYGRKALVIYLVIGAYFLIPIAANLTGKPFTFWQESYIEIERSLLELLDSMEVAHSSQEEWNLSEKEQEAAADTEPETEQMLLLKVVNVKTSLGIREKAGLSEKVLQSLKLGDIVTFLGEVTTADDEEWLYVESADGIIGWTRSRYVEEISGNI